VVHTALISISLNHHFDADDSHQTVRQVKLKNVVGVSFDAVEEVVVCVHPYLDFKTGQYHRYPQFFIRNFTTTILYTTNLPKSKKPTPENSDISNA